MRIKRLLKKMRYSRRKTSMLSLVLIILVFGLTIGYAYVHTTLEVDGTVNVSSANWNVYWDNIVIGSDNHADVTAAPTISTGKTEVTFSVTFNDPGDKYEFTVDAVNDGTIDAMISNVDGGVYETDGVTSKPLPDYLEYDFTYSDGEMIEQYHKLETGERETYVISVHYKKGYDISQLPTEDTDYVFKFGINYVQASTNAFVRPDVVTGFTISDSSNGIGEALPNGTVVYDNYQDAIAALGHNFFFKNKMENGIVTEKYIGFVYNDNLYYLRGADEDSYDSNKSVMQTAFGASNCEEFYSDFGLAYRCTPSSGEAYISGNGSISIDDNNFQCYIQYDGSTSCYSY